MKKLLAITVLTLAAAGIVTGCSGKDIGRDAALEAAFNDAGVSESDTTRLKVSEDRDDGRKVYEIQFDVDNTEYDYEIQASDGSILSSETENRVQVQSNSQYGSDDAAGQNNVQDDGQNTQDNGQNSNQGQTNTQTGNANVAVTREQAIETALSRVSGATEQEIRIELDRDDGAGRAADGHIPRGKKLRDFVLCHFVSPAFLCLSI